ncbi:TonB-dependent receptor [Thalassotalea marina]|uniref:TonB-dependent receptor n=1 Tax=Thalassotalea marina TaxID=1673741 RepID=A0A919BCP7_9GAMM|nr:TonB-dependent receptor [Thalassotalea marina]GHF82944.1 hypothetical protein GCM10017161_07730 [Thalassotalea marina]
MKLSPIATACALSLAYSNLAGAQDVSGVVKTTEGQPIVNAKVAVVNSKKQVLTDNQGRFVFTDLAKGPLELHVVAENFSHRNKKLVVTEEDISGVNFVLAPTVMEIIDVHATPLHSSTIESALPVNVISSDELRTKQASTLGETLKNEVGVHSTYFGPVASSPIIRGLDGPRVLVTQNGLDAADASRVGPDHVVASETATAQQIEVLRGPATLFYGSGAIGGVVNVVDDRVPTSLDDNVNYMFKHNTVASEDEASISLNKSSGQLAFHLDGFWRDGEDYKIPGYAESIDAHDDHDEHEEHDEHDEHEEHEEHELGAKGKLPNSAAKASGFTVGSSYILDNGFIGFSYGKLSREYGIPGHSHGHDEHEDEHDDHEEHEESVYGDLEQDRIQLLSELTFDQGFINKVSSKVAYTDYQHKEIENGEVGTVFNNEMTEARFDVYHQAFEGWKGAWTLHYKHTDFEALGEEAFTPPSKTSSVALAWLEEKHFDDVLLQLGARIEHVEIEAKDSFIEHDHEEHEHDEHEEDDHHEDDGHFEKQSFTPVSLSAGLVWDYQPGYNLGFSVAYAQRAPSAAELFSNGPHIGTNSFEVGALYELHYEGEDVHVELGDQRLELETSTNLDITWRKFEGDLGFVVGAFYNQIDDFFFQGETVFFAEGAHDHDDHDEEHAEDEHAEGELPIYLYQQRDIEMYGLEAEVVYQWSANLRSTIFGDYTRAKLKDGGNLPRIPPMRVGAQFDYLADQYSAQLSVSHYFKQDDIAPRETDTEAYTLVDVNFNYYLEGIGDDFVIFVKGNNLTDEEARVHTSFLKDIAPLPGRGVEFGIRGSF